MRERVDMLISFRERETLRRGLSRSQQGRWPNEPEAVNDLSRWPLCPIDETCSTHDCIHPGQNSSLLKIVNTRE